MTDLLAVLDSVDFWHWWILAAVLIVIEVFAPTTLFLWTGISAVVVGGIAFFVGGISWQVQFLLFAVLSVASVFAWRQYARTRARPDDGNMLNRRGAQYVGRVFTLEGPIVDGVGHLRVDDTTWKIEGSDCASGARIQVTQLDGSVLKVEPVNGQQTRT